jgi:hypothetical protein
MSKLTERAKKILVKIYIKLKKILKINWIVDGWIYGGIKI